MPRLRQPREVAPPASVRFEQPDPKAAQDKKVGGGLELESPEGAESTEVEALERQAERDAAADLKKQIEALKRAEQEQRERADKAERERQQARQEAVARAAEVERFKNEVTQSRATTFDTGIAKETEAVEAAKRDIAAAHSSGDTDALVAAYDRLSEARSRLETLKNGKAAIDAEIEEAKSRKPEKEEPRNQNPTVEEAIDGTTLPETAKRWLKDHPEYMTDQRKNAKIQSLHWDVVDEGHAPFSRAYYESLEVHLGLRKAARQEEPEEEEEDSSSVVSAPVSREVPSASGRRDPGRVKLSAAQKEAAKMAGITETEYAKQLLKFQEAKDSGNYGEKR